MGRVQASAIGTGAIDADTVPVPNIRLHKDLFVYYVDREGGFAKKL